jgi:polyisoprenoid-binding protein YceI
MSTWIFEPGHTEAEFRARHMMVTWVRGLFKDIHGRLELEWDRCLDATFKGQVDLTLRAVTGTVPLDIVSLGEWKTPFWVGEENKGELLRIGFEATAKLNRRDFGVSWQDDIPGGGVVVSNEFELNLDLEAILLDDLERTGAIAYYLPQDSA